MALEKAQRRLAEAADPLARFRVLADVVFRGADDGNRTLE
jgi:hypothetical protein